MIHPWASPAKTGKSVVFFPGKLAKKYGDRHKFASIEGQEIVGEGH